mmetsp:Transcript_6584/g.15054  ORF Transcript_6584/g.15054 Transcript_6584/m.15054 type:complete len:325 (-) Transcript_6584:138-1112(-)
MMIIRASFVLAILAVAGEGRVISEIVQVMPAKSVMLRECFIPAQHFPISAMVKGKALSLSQTKRGISTLKCGLYGDDIATKKDALFIPATSRLHWREYRSRLIKAETPFWMRRASLHTGLWAHELWDIEQGCLMIETGRPSTMRSDDYQRAYEGRVIFVLHHSQEHGSYGLILNKATPCTIGDFTEKLPHFDENTIHYGGEGHKALQGQVANRELHTIHSCSEVAGSEEIINGVYLGADLRHASKLVEQKRAKAGQFKFFYSATQWRPGQLQQELTEGRWVAAACSKELILYPTSYWEKPLWKIVMEVMGGKFSLMCRELCDDL